MPTINTRRSGAVSKMRGALLRSIRVQNRRLTAEQSSFFQLANESLPRNLGSVREMCLSCAPSLMGLLRMISAIVSTCTSSSKSEGLANDPPWCYS